MNEQTRARTRLPKSHGGCRWYAVEHRPYSNDNVKGEIGNWNFKYTDFIQSFLFFLRQLHFSVSYLITQKNNAAGNWLVRELCAKQLTLGKLIFQHSVKTYCRDRSKFGVLKPKQNCVFDILWGWCYSTLPYGQYSNSSTSVVFHKKCKVYS